MKKNNNKTIRNNHEETFKEISKMIEESAGKGNAGVSEKYKKKERVKMPMKMYSGIKKAVLRKEAKEKAENCENNIIASTHQKQKKMTGIILSRTQEQKEKRKNRKLFLSRKRHQSKFQKGVLNLPKNFLKESGKKTNHIQSQTKKKKD